MEAHLEQYVIKWDAHWTEASGPDGLQNGRPQQLGDRPFTDMNQVIEEVEICLRRDRYFVFLLGDNRVWTPTRIGDDRLTAVAIVVMD